MPTNTALATKAEQLVDRRVDADGGGLVLVLADGDQAHAELGAPDPPRQQQRQRQQREQHVVERPFVVDAPHRQRQGEPAVPLVSDTHLMATNWSRNRNATVMITNDVAARAEGDQTEQRGDQRRDHAGRPAPTTSRDVLDPVARIADV